MAPSLSKNLDIMANSLLEEFGDTLRRQMTKSADELWNGRFDRLLTPVIQAQIQHALVQTECDDLFVFLLDKNAEGLVPVHRKSVLSESGEVLEADDVIIRDGLLTMVCASGQSICDNGIQNNPFWTSEIEEMLSGPVKDVIVTPLRFADRLRGVACFVRAESNPKSGSSAHNFKVANLMSSTLEPLLDLHLAEMILRWN